MVQLDQVKRAARAKARADARYRQAVEEALAAGHSYADVAKALNVSRQAVRQFVTR